MAFAGGVSCLDGGVSCSTGDVFAAITDIGDSGSPKTFSHISLNLSFFRIQWNAGHSRISAVVILSLNFAASSKSHAASISSLIAARQRRKLGAAADQSVYFKALENFSVSPFIL